MLRSYSDSFLNQYYNDILKCIAVSCLKNVLYCNKSIFPVNFEIQIQLHRLQASWFNLVNRLADGILLR